MKIKLLFLFLLGSGLGYAQDSTVKKAELIEIVPKVFVKFDEDSKVDLIAWRNIVQNPEIQKALKNGLKPGTHTILIRFLLEKDSSIVDIKSVTNVGYGLEDAVIKVIKKNYSRWQPGIINKESVRSYCTSSITFIVE